jgi:hypothetical protein
VEDFFGRQGHSASVKGSGGREQGTVNGERRTARSTALGQRVALLRPVFEVRVRRFLRVNRWILRVMGVWYGGRRLNARFRTVDLLAWLKRAAL